MAKSRTRQSVRYRQSSTVSLLVIVAVLFVCIFSVVNASSLYAKSRELAETERAMELKVEQAKQEQENLAAQEQYMQTYQYIEDVAKDKLGLVYPDEIVIRPAE